MNEDFDSISIKTLIPLTQVLIIYEIFTSSHFFSQLYIYIYYPLSLWCICRLHAPNDMIGQIIYEKFLFYQVFARVS